MSRPSCWPGSGGNREHRDREVFPSVRRPRRRRDHGPMTPDCVFEDTSPPDGRRHEGAAAVREAWTALFTTAADGVFTTEEMIEAGDGVVARWRYDWGAGQVRGVDIFTVRDGLVAEKLSYV